MTLILGIDPGSRITGYGVVRDTGRGCVYVASGCIRTGSGLLHERLQIVYRGVREVIQTYGPVTMGIEKVFMARNADSALKLGQARGAAIVAGAEESLEIAEYTATQVKQAVAGTGGHAFAQTDDEASDRRLRRPGYRAVPCTYALKPDTARLEYRTQSRRAAASLIASSAQTF